MVGGGEEGAGSEALVRSILFTDPTCLSAAVHTVIQSCNVNLYKERIIQTIAILNNRDAGHGYSMDKKKLDSKDYKLNESIYLRLSIRNKGY